MQDLLVKNGTVVFPFHTQKCNITVKDGKISGVTTEEPQAARTIDATGKTILAGMIDSHFHASDPGGVRADWEGFTTGTKALAKGGVTAFIDMPLNNLPATVDGASAQVKLVNAADKCYVDYGLFGGLVPFNLDKLGELEQAGVLAYKCFMSQCGSDIPGDFVGVDDYTLYKGMCILAEKDALLCIHAENAPITEGLAADSRAQGKGSMQDYADSRPEWTETEAVSRAIALSEASGCKIHIMHVSASKTIELIQAAQVRGVKVSFESCPHYLLFSQDDFAQYGLSLKCSPPIRNKENQEKMWAYLLSGAIAILSSDHSPCPPYMKDYGNAFDAWGGIAGGQNVLDLLISEAVGRHGMDISALSRVVSLNPAQRYGIKSKGQIALGYDGDLVIADLKRSYTLTSAMLEYQHKVSPYVGKEINCVIEETIVRGDTVYNHESGFTPKPGGHYIRK